MSTGMLCKAFSHMTAEQFSALPCSTNVVESHNRLSKGTSPDPLEIAMLATYKTDMVAALRHLASSQGLKTTYEDLSPLQRSKRVAQANKARRKRRVDDDAEGPPDKRQHFQVPKVTVRTVHLQRETHAPIISYQQIFQN